jgi:hypothetical protein
MKPSRKELLGSLITACTTVALVVKQSVTGEPHAAHDEDRWITTKPKGEEGKGRHIKIDEEGKIVGGAVPKEAQGKPVTGWWKEGGAPAEKDPAAARQPSDPVEQSKRATAAVSKTNEFRKNHTEYQKAAAANQKLKQGMAQYEAMQKASASATAAPAPATVLSRKELDKIAGDVTQNQLAKLTGSSNAQLYDFINWARHEYEGGAQSLAQAVTCSAMPEGTSCP